MVSVLISSPPLLEQLSKVPVGRPDVSGPRWMAIITCQVVRIAYLDKQGVLESITFELLGSHEGRKGQKDGRSGT